MARTNPLNPYANALKITTNCTSVSAVAYFVDSDLVTKVALAALIQAVVSTAGFYCDPQDDNTASWKVALPTSVVQIGVSALVLGMDIKSVKIAAAIWVFVRIPKLTMALIVVNSCRETWKKAIVSSAGFVCHPAGVFDILCN